MPNLSELNARLKKLANDYEDGWDIDCALAEGLIFDISQSLNTNEVSADEVNQMLDTTFTLTIYDAHRTEDMSYRVFLKNYLFHQDTQRDVASFEKLLQDKTAAAKKMEEVDEETHGEEGPTTKVFARF